MTALGRASAFLLPFWCLGACNMVYSETPMFTDADRGKLVPRDGIWLAEIKDCSVDSSKPESTWPECAVWIIARDSGRELLLTDGKGQTQHIIALYAAGTPMIAQGQWIDEAKEPATAHYGFQGLEPQRAGSDERFSAALTWGVECGIQEDGQSKIRPFPGISAECRPSTKDAIRKAALSSRRREQISWRWLRPAAP